MSNIYYTTSGNTIHLDREIGHGGEGLIYLIRGYPSEVAKIYIKQQPPEIHRKILAMVQNPPHDPTVNGPTKHRSIAWPSDIVYGDRQKTKFAGLIMPKVDTKAFKPILKYFEPDLRIKEFVGGITWLHLYYIARNLSSCVAALHEGGYLIGDINESNILVHEHTILSVIDCDSFQFKEPRTGELFRCKVGKGEYTAPELLGINFADIDRTEATDCFALSVIIFRLLMEGIGPYQAVGPLVANLPTTEDKIKFGVFSYNTSKSGIEPKPDAPSFDIFPTEIRALFIRCFDAGHKDGSHRPAAKEWLSVFRNLTQNIKQCTLNENHQYFNHLRSCPWCERLKKIGKDSFPSPVGLQVPILDPNNPAVTRQDMEAYLLSLVKMFLMDGDISPEEEAFLIDQGLKLHISEKDTKKFITSEVQKRGVSGKLTGAGIPKIEVSKTRFDFPNIRREVSITDSLTISNVGGGALSGLIKTNKNWLKASQSNIDTTRHKQDISFYVDPANLAFGFKDTATIEIQSNGGTESIFVGISVEMPEEDLSRFRKTLTLGGLALGGLFGYFVYNMNVIQGMNENIAGIAGILAIIGAVIVAGCLGYRDKEAGVAFGSGCGTLIGLIILFLILGSYFPHALSVCSWTLTYGSLAYMLSSPIRKALWQRNMELPIIIGFLTLALTGGIVLAGFISAKQKGEDKLARSKAELSRSKAIQRSIQATAIKLPGEWDGNVDNSMAKLYINQQGGQLSGKMVYYGVEEELLVDFKEKDGQVFVVLKGTSYKKLKGKGRFNLDTFYGTLSTDGHSIRGKYVDAGRKKGKWSVSKVASAPRTRRLFVETEPVDAMIKILNIPPKFYQGMELDPGRYHVEISANGYKTEKTWIELGGGEDSRINVSLVKIKEVDSVTTEPKYKEILKKEKRPASDDSVRSLPPPPTY